MTPEQISKHERNAYREACAEMVKQLRIIQSEISFTKKLSAQLDLYSAIEKAEKLLGENNAT